MSPLISDISWPSFLSTFVHSQHWYSCMWNNYNPRWGLDSWLTPYPPPALYWKCWSQLDHPPPMIFTLYPTSLVKLDNFVPIILTKRFLDNKYVISIDEILIGHNEFISCDQLGIFPGRFGGLDIEIILILISQLLIVWRCVQLYQCFSEITGGVLHQQYQIKVVFHIKGVGVGANIFYLLRSVSPPNLVFLNSLQFVTPHIQSPVTQWGVGSAGGRNCKFRFQ